MNWENLTIGKKIAVGFGMVLGLLAAVLVLSYHGVGGIINNAGRLAFVPIRTMERIECYLIHPDFLLS